MAIPYVFVSHASDDKKRVKPLIEALVLHGLNVWIDRLGLAATPPDSTPGSSNGMEYEDFARVSLGLVTATP